MITEIAREWLGTKWVHAQSNKQVACDCVGFLMGVAREANLNIPEIITRYPRLPKHDEIKKYLDANFQQTANIDYDRILLIKISGISCHVAIATSPNTMIHADSVHGYVLEQKIDGIWLNRISYVYTIEL